MSAIIQQLGLDYTYFVQLGILATVFVLLSNVYFKPFQKLFESRHKRMVEDREAAENLLKQADARFEEYRKRLHDERGRARQEMEAVIAEAKKEESAILNEARNEAKRITQEAAESVAKQREQVSRSLQSEVEALAQQISQTLLVRQEK